MTQQQEDKEKTRNLVCRLCATSPMVTALHCALGKGGGGGTESHFRLMGTCHFGVKNGGPKNLSVSLKNRPISLIIISNMNPKNYDAI